MDHAAVRNNPRLPLASAARHAETPPSVKEQLKNGLAGTGCLIFTTATGKPLNRHNVRNQGVVTAADKGGLNPAGAEKVTTHDLRRSYVSHLILGLGLDPVQVAKIFGQKDVSMTLNIYAGEFDRAMHQDDLRARIEQAGFGAVR